MWNSSGLTRTFYESQQSCNKIMGHWFPFISFLNVQELQKFSCGDEIEIITYICINIHIIQITYEVGNMTMHTKFNNIVGTSQKLEVFAAVQSLVDEATGVFSLCFTGGEQHKSWAAWWNYNEEIIRQNITREIPTPCTSPVPLKNPYFNNL